MDRTDDKAQALNLPPVYSRTEKHGVFPDISHDETARFNFLASLNYYLDTVVEPGNKVVFEKRVRPQFQANAGRDFKTVDEVKEAMSQDAQYQLWSGLKRSLLEMIQQASRSVVFRQIDSLAEKAQSFTNQHPETLQLDPNLAVPGYLTGFDHHGLPGGYCAEYSAGDVANAASEDVTSFLLTKGTSGALADGLGRGVVHWMKENYPDFKPKRILDIGCGVGHNTLPLANGYPDAEIIGIDVSAPMLRYAHARAVSLGVGNVTFIQANAETLPFSDASFDWALSTNFLHETSASAIYSLIGEIYRLLKPNGLTLHVEPVFHTQGMPLFEQFMHDWYSFNNNEPLRRVIHKMDRTEWLKSAGFADDDFIQFGVRPVNDEEPGRQTSAIEFSGQNAPTTQQVVGAWKR